MAKVITFSRTFPAYHPRQGEPTFFVEQIYNSLFSKNNLMYYPVGLEINDTIMGVKKHTIRAGNRWKVGDKFSPRVWSGKPYNSPQIIIAPDMEIKKVWDLEFAGISMEMTNCTLGTKEFYKPEEEIFPQLATNDGLSYQDFLDWFKPYVFDGFKGQIICWNENVNY